MKSDPQPGVAFERVVAEIQAQFDPSAQITHNEHLTDRLGQSRQFDVVIRGTVAGHQVLGVIECKDLSRKVGTPEVDAFVTKASDVNANLRILISKNGFSGPALEKCKHYGIRALSLFDDLPAGRFFAVGARWEADIFAWSEIRCTVIWADEDPPGPYTLEGLTADGTRLLDSLTNYLLKHHDDLNTEGWLRIDTVFNAPRLLQLDDGFSALATGVHFDVQRICQRYKLTTKLGGRGYFDWQTRQASFPPGADLCLGAVSGDFSQWDPRNELDEALGGGVISFKVFGRADQFSSVAHAPDLDDL